MKLRSRFTLWFAIASLLPIVAAAIITRFVLVSRSQADYRAERAATEQVVRREVQRLEAQVATAVASLASLDHPFVGGVLRDLVKGVGELDTASRRRIREDESPVMRGLSLDALTVTGVGDLVLASPHNRAAIGEVNGAPRQQAGQPPAFAFVDVLGDGEPSPTKTLVVQAAAVAREGPFSVAVQAGRALGDDALATVRRPGRVDARVIAGDGDNAPWTNLRGAPIRLPLAGSDGKSIATIEIVVADGGLDEVLRRITLGSVVLAVIALLVTALLGILVARRITRRLDLLADGAEQAARGNLSHRVNVTGRDEIGAVAAAFNDMLDELRTSKDRLVIAERIAAWQEIARRLAHEIKNPLTPIQMSMDTLRKTHRMGHPQFDEILEESTTTVLQEAERLRHIVSEFASFARMPKPNVQLTDVSEVVASALALYQGDAVERELAQGLPRIAADRDQLSQVVLNLVENARDAIADGRGSRIVVSTRLGKHGDRVELRVEDNGPGVPAELSDRVFAPYVTTKEGQGGTGLGLAIVHRIIADHGGRIFIVDAVGGGACFVIELPIEEGAQLRAGRSTSGMRAQR